MKQLIEMLEEAIIVWTERQKEINDKTYAQGRLDSYLKILQLINTIKKCEND